jgi:NarL family two-component system response regulator LiaR
MCEDLLPDVILMDIMMPVLDGIAATTCIYERWPHIHIIALSSFHEQDLVQRVLRAGAMAYLLKNVQAHDLAEAIRAAVAGQSTMPLEVTRTLLQPDTPPASFAPDLSPREQEVLALMVEGLRNEQIAARLTVSRNTVRYHVHNILSKLGATNRTEAVSLAMSHNLLS